MINACVVGLGNRGYSLIQNVLVNNDDINIVAVCDIYEDRVQKALELIKGKKGVDVKGYFDYKEAFNNEVLDAVYVFTGWEYHTEIAICAMEKGIAVASEVGCEYSLENLFNLVETQERTCSPYMFMENCCYNKDELLATAMARKGKFGTIVHCSGAYGHDLRREVSHGIINRHYRFKNYENRCLENYPTHELGPIAKLLNINRGNRIVSVSAFATKAVGLKEYIANCEDADEVMKNTQWKQGDIVTTVITCANGETILLRLDTTLPRSYSREFTVRGTKGLYTQENNSVYLDGEKEYWEPVDYNKATIDNAKNYEEEFLPDIWKNITPEQMERGHGGMDWFVYKAFADAVQNGDEMPIDVYDGATWMAVSVLSEMSIAAGGAPQLMPDFTKGRWHLRAPKDVIKF